MGAVSIVVSARGRNMHDAFRNAQREAEEEYGHQQGYSGEINCCELEADWTNKRSQYPEDDHFHEAILNQTSKREVIGYCTQDPITNKNKIKTVVTPNPQKGARKFETRYQVVSYSESVISSHKTQTEAVKAARTYVEKNPSIKVQVVVAKILTSGNKVCATINYKKATNERLGTYVFVGYAPC